MKIALDLDNTLINYGDLFAKGCHLEGLNIPSSLSKEEIKNFIQESNNHQWPEDWIRVQGRVYGELILEAKVDPNILELLKNEDVEIVSHKTLISICGRYELQSMAKKWLEINGLSGVRTSFFEDISLKIDYINNECFDLIIDDLEEVLKRISPEIIKLHFSNKSSLYFSSVNWKDILTLIKHVRPNKIERLATNTFLVETEKGRKILKRSEIFERLQREKWAAKLGLCSRTMYADGDGFILYDYIDNLKAIKFDSDFSLKYKDFFNRLQKKKNSIKFQATHGIKCEKDYYKNIEERLFFEFGELRESFITILNHLKCSPPQDSSEIKLKVCFPDFFRENFYDRGGDLIVLDFESFGQDDLCRSYLNAIHHFGHELSFFEKKELGELFNSLKENDDDFWNRCLRVFDLVALEWLLIASKREENLPKVNSLVKIMLDNIRSGKRYISWEEDIAKDIHDKFKK